VYTESLINKLSTYKESVQPLMETFVLDVSNSSSVIQRSSTPNH